MVEALAPVLVVVVQVALVEALGASEEEMVKVA